MTTTELNIFPISSMKNPEQTETEPYIYTTRTEHEPNFKVLRTQTEANPYHQTTRTEHEPKMLGYFSHL